MNLPLEYNKLSEYFDVLSSDNSNVMNRAIEKVLKKHKVKTVLDLTCGTGSQVFWLIKRGYQVIGSDLSPELIKIAKSKARKENIKVKLLKGDMRTKQVGRFDAVITIHNAVGHLGKTDFEKAMRNIHGNLKKGGLYVFDIFNLNSMSDRVVENLKMDIVEMVGDTSIRLVQYSKINKKSGRLTSYDRFSVQERAGKPKVLKGSFALQIYTAQELREMLVRNGFAVLDQCGLDGSKLSERKTKQILTLARKL